MIPFYEKNDYQLKMFYSEGLNFPAHLHDALELVFVEQGELRMEIGGTEYRLKKGDFVCVFPEVIHAYEDIRSHGEESERNRILLVICGPRMIEETKSLFLNRYPVNPVLREGEYPGEIVYALDQLVKEEHEGRSLLVQRGILLFLIGKLMPLLTLEKIEIPPSHQLVHRLISYMEEHYRERISLTELAAHLGVSKYHLSRIFSKYLHTSFTDYLNQLRLEYAMSLIRRSSRSFLDIALDSGFESQRTFNRAFQKLHGMTPSQYAAEMREKRLG